MAQSQRQDDAVGDIDVAAAQVVAPSLWLIVHRPVVRNDTVTAPVS